MQTKDQISMIRKTLYGLMMLALILSTFGAWNVPTARAQETAAETLAGAIVGLSADQSFFGTTEDVILHVTITNPNSYSIRMLKWLTPVGGVERSLFTVTRDGKSVVYVGKIVKRVAPTEKDYIVLAAGESLTRDVNLSDYYNLSISGTYAVKYNVVSSGLYATEDGKQFNTADHLTSNMMELSIEGRANRVLQEVNPQVVTGTNGFFGCSASQQTDLVNARDAASIYAANAVSYFAASKQGARYTTWFGVYDASRYSAVSSHFSLVQNAVDTASPMNFDCTCTDAGVYAYVFPNSPFNIYLCPAFWSSSTTGTDSKAGTLIHEITHFTVVADTDDHAYGQAAAQALAISNPALAVMNADSHEYFAENNPPLEAVSYTFGDVPDTYWAWNYIEQLYSAGITGGCSVIPLNYCPDSTVTRAQMAVFLLKGIHGSSYSPPAVGAGTGFTDVATDYWAAAWIKQLATEGITGGCGSGNYCPDTTVTRAQMAIFLLKAKYGSSFSPSPATGVFTDVPVGYWADKWIERLASEGITGGCGTGIYCPDSPVTRAQMAVFLVKTFIGVAMPSNPSAGFWSSTTDDEFYVTPDSAFVDDFSIYVDVSGCGSYMITHTTPEPITSKQFSFSGTFYASGTFGSSTTASGTDGLSSFSIPSCGAVSGGPWSWNATWQNGSQPMMKAYLVGPEIVEQVPANGSYYRVTPLGN